MYLLVICIFFWNCPPILFAHTFVELLVVFIDLYTYSIYLCILCHMCFCGTLMFSLFMMAFVLQEI